MAQESDLALETMWKGQAWSYVSIVPTAGKQREEDPCDLLASQPNQTGESQAKGEALWQKPKVDSI